MAISTLRLRIDRHHPAMDGLRILHFLGNIRMTGRTALIHRCAFPRRAVTDTAVPVDFGMRSKATHRLALDGIQRTGAEHHTAAREGISRDGKDRDGYGDHPRPRETTQAVSAHSPLLCFRLLDFLRKYFLPRTLCVQILADF
jgi:hypothetical protein